MSNADTPNYRKIALRITSRGEGLRLKAYQDTKGIWTIGYGHNIEANPLSGRSLETLRAKGITKEEADALLLEDLARAEKDLLTIAPSFPFLGDVRKAVLIDMSFNLGRTRLSKFLGFLGALFVRDFTKAAYEILDSQYQRDVKARAWKNAIMMATGIEM